MIPHDFNSITYVDVDFGSHDVLTWSILPRDVHGSFREVLKII